MQVATAQQEAEIRLAQASATHHAETLAAVERARAEALAEARRSASEAVGDALAGTSLLRLLLLVLLLCVALLSFLCLYSVDVAV
eukprot:COSAG05_NODE_1181_length_5596_cov_3.093687_2_plen_85_part_00